MDFERSVTDAAAEAAATDRAPPAVELDGVTKRYGDTAAVDDVSLRVREGEFFTLVGPSGCGKTTTLRLIAGFEEPTAGTVRFFGESVAGVPPEDRDVGVVFQNYALFPHMTVGENVAYGLNFADPPGGVTRDERVAELLELVDLPDAADRDPESLSGGQQQRVAMARALAPGPDVLLLDEPMSALDAQLRERLRVQVRTIQSELGITTVYVTHDQEEALAISDRVAVMRDGAPEQIAPPRTVYREPATRFVAEFVGDNNVFAGRTTDVEGADTADEGASGGDVSTAADEGAS
ncbi:MAG: ABC transporter ATP-binding protein, partial [Halobacteriota archaeon]